MGKFPFSLVSFKIFYNSYHISKKNEWIASINGWIIKKCSCDEFYTILDQSFAYTGQILPWAGSLMGLAHGVRPYALQSVPALPWPSLTLPDWTLCCLSSAPHGQIPMLPWPNPTHQHPSLNILSSTHDHAIWPVRLPMVPEIWKARK